MLSTHVYRLSLLHQDQTNSRTTMVLNDYPAIYRGKGLL